MLAVRERRRPADDPPQRLPAREKSSISGVHRCRPDGEDYQRYDYLKERRAALELWGETLMRIVNQQ
jgi:hypothetical protein